MISKIKAFNYQGLELSYHHIYREANQYAYALAKNDVLHLEIVCQFIMHPIFILHLLDNDLWEILSPSSLLVLSLYGRRPFLLPKKMK